MYKVLLIDDESIILEGLTRILPWEKYGCQVVGTACDGDEGAEMIAEHRPDILFTDIQMPGKDGLTMLAGLKSEHPDLQVTVLTGFRDFTYAQEAIRLGVTRFLLKPSKMDELQEALEAMTQNLKKLGRVEEAAEKEPQNHGDVANSFIVRKAVEYIEMHYTEHISLGDVAEYCFVSHWHLSKLLNKYTEKNFYDLLNGVRISKAKELLRDPALRISEISEQIGYGDTAHFSRVFKKMEGISANEYRNLRAQ